MSNNKTNVAMRKRAGFMTFVFSSDRFTDLMKLVAT